MTTWTAAQIEAHNAKVARDAQAARESPRPVRKLSEDRPRKAIICGVLPLSGHFEPKNVNLPHEDHIDPETPNAKQRKRKAPLARSGEGEAQSPKSVPGGIGDCRPRVRFTLFRVRLLDVDAAYSSTKDTLDCCWLSQIVDGDRPDQITLLVEQQKVASFKNEKTVIEIEFPEP